MKALTLSGDQWLVLDLLVKAQRQGIPYMNRMALLEVEELPLPSRMRLVFAALTMPEDLVRWMRAHDFSITESGIAAYNLRFGAVHNKPAERDPDIICLPDLSQARGAIH